MKRGAPPEGGGEVVFSCPVRRTLRPIQFTDAGKIKRIRGLAYPLHFFNLIDEIHSLEILVLCKFLGGGVSLRL